MKDGINRRKNPKHLFFSRSSFLSPLVNGFAFPLCLSMMMKRTAGFAFFHTLSVLRSQSLILRDSQYIMNLTMQPPVYGVSTTYTYSSFTVIIFKMCEHRHRSHCIVLLPHTTTLIIKIREISPSLCLQVTDKHDS